MFVVPPIRRVRVGRAVLCPPPTANRRCRTVSRFRRHPRRARSDAPYRVCGFVCRPSVGRAVLCPPIVPDLEPNGAGGSACWKPRDHLSARGRLEARPTFDCIVPLSRRTPPRVAGRSAPTADRSGGRVVSWRGARRSRRSIGWVAGGEAFGSGQVLGEVAQGPGEVARRRMVRCPTIRCRNRCSTVGTRLGGWRRQCLSIEAETRFRRDGKAAANGNAERGIPPQPTTPSTP